MGDNLFNEYFKFAFVRDPVDRLISAYYFLNRKNNNIITPNVTVLNNFYENRKSKIHILPQYKFIYGDNGELLVNYIGYTNNMEDSLIHIYKKLGFKMFTNVPKINQTNKDKHVNDEIKDLVHRLYYND